MIRRLLCCVAPIALAVLMTVPVHAQLSPYAQDFEFLDQADPGALTTDGWLVFGNVFDGVSGGYLYGYGVFGAPNGGAAFSAIDFGQGGLPQGDQQLVIYNDYNNGDHGNGHWIEANVFQEQIVGAGDVGQTWVFSFDAKRGNINDANSELCPCSTTALAFIKTLDPNNGFQLTNFISVDTTDLPDTWGSFDLSIEIDASLPGQIFQIGFASTATLFQPSGVLYDNINFAVETCNVEPTVTINACDSGVSNDDLASGCTMNDAIDVCAEDAIHQGAFVSCVANLANGWADEGLLNAGDNGKIIRCAARYRRSFGSTESRKVPVDEGSSIDGVRPSYELGSSGSSLRGSRRGR